MNSRFDLAGCTRNYAYSCIGARIVHVALANFDLEVVQSKSKGQLLIY